MSLLRLLVVLLALFSLSAALAEDQPDQSKNNSIKITIASPMTDYQKDATYDVVQGLLHHNVRNGIVYPDPTCYTMRTYVADRNVDKRFVMKAAPGRVSYTPQKRDGAQQESPLSGSYTTCQSSAHFEMKSAVQTIEVSPDSK